MMSNDRIASLLKDMAKRCRDSEEGYRAAVEESHDHELKQQFRQLSRERGDMAGELDALIRKYGGEPPAAGGTMLGAAHRMFTDLRASLSRDERQAVLAEVARGESAAEESYDVYKKEELPQDVREVLKRHHDRVRATRDRYRQMSGQMGTGSGAIAAAWQGPQAVGQVMHDRPLLSASMMFLLGFIAGAAAAAAFARSGSYGGSWSWGEAPGAAAQRRRSTHTYRY
jgi:uncharacterized protein (TIGR02284 family)